MGNFMQTWLVDLHKKCYCAAYCSMRKCKICFNQIHNMKYVEVVIVHCAANSVGIDCSYWNWLFLTERPSFCTLCRCCRFADFFSVLGGKLHQCPSDSSAAGLPADSRHLPSARGGPHIRLSLCVANSSRNKGKCKLSLDL